MSKELFERISYISVGLVAVMLILMLARVVPVDWYIYFVIVGIVLMLFRFIGRIVFMIVERKKPSS